MLGERTAWDVGFVTILGEEASCRAYRGSDSRGSFASDTAHHRTHHPFTGELLLGPERTSDGLRLSEPEHERARRPLILAARSLKRLSHTRYASI